jgi:5-hydroxyisourate hydrolase-like protein (transthyretin family)
MARAQVLLRDGNKNPSVGVHLGLTLLQGGASLPITTETTDSHGRAAFQVGEALAAGQYQYEVNVIDDGIFAPPQQLSQFTIGTKPTILTTWASNGNIAAALLDSNSQTPVPGRLLVLEGQLKDGNWTIISTAYTDDNGGASFTPPASQWRVSFGGDTFYSPSSSNTLSSYPNSFSPSTLIQTGTQSSTSLRNTLSNGHITLSIQPDTITIYDSQGQTILGQMGWDVQVRTLDSWQSLPSDGGMSMTIDDFEGYHRIILQGTAGNGQVSISMQFLGRIRDPSFTPFRTPVEIHAFGSQHSYRLLWHVETDSAASFQFEQRTGDQRTVIRGPIASGSLADQSPSGENSMVALAQDGKTVLFGFNWDNALQYYQGTSLGMTGGQSSASVAFGTFTLSNGQGVILPACPCPDGGGGGGGGPLGTSTTLYLPSSAYATINTVLKAQLKDQFGNPVSFATMTFSKDGSSIGTGTTNTTGYASLVWSPGVTGSHVISAAFAGNCCYLASSTQQSLTINQTPTAILFLKPQQIAYSWDLYNYYGGNGRPIVVPVVTLALAGSGSGGPANIVMPSYSGTSFTLPNLPGYGWAGLNQTTVTVTFNSTYTQTRTMNWTRNFYLPPCPNPPSCSTAPRTGHMYLTGSLAPPSTLYTPNSTSLNIPYQNVNSLSNAPLQLIPDTDGSAVASCGLFTTSCSVTLTTSHPDDIIIAFTSEALDLHPAVANGFGYSMILFNPTSTNPNNPAPWNTGQAQFVSGYLNTFYPSSNFYLHIYCIRNCGLGPAYPNYAVATTLQPQGGWLNFTWTNPGPCGVCNTGIVAGPSAYPTGAVIWTQWTWAEATTTGNFNAEVDGYAVDSGVTSPPICSFSVSDTAGLFWTARSGTLGRNGLDQFQEFYAKSRNVLSSDTITESISGCGNNYNGLQVFAISGANFDNPFDPGAGGSASGYSGGTYAAISTSNPGDIVFAAVQHGSSVVPTSGPGFSIVTSTAGYAVEKEIANGILTRSNVTFGDSAVDYWEEIADALQPGNPMVQDATPPPLFINVNATYPYLTVTMQRLPVALAAYVAYLAFSLGGPTSSFLSGGYTVYALPTQSDFARVCYDSACNTPAGNVQLYLYNSKLQFCGVAVSTDNRGITPITAQGSKSTCTYPYGYVAIYTSGTTLQLTELFQIEVVNNPTPFYTNFQGFNYATYAPKRTGRYLLHVFTYFLNSPYTILYPTTSYPDVAYPYLAGVDVILNVQKHPVSVDTSSNPGTSTILDITKATIRLTDLARSTPLNNTSFGYTLTQTDPGSIVVASGSLTTGADGTVVVSFGKLSYGNYTLSVARAEDGTIQAVNYSYKFTVYKAMPTLLLRNLSGLQSATPGMFKLLNPSGGVYSPSIVTSQSAPYEFYAVLGTSTDLLTTPPGVTANCAFGSPMINCVQIYVGYGSSQTCFTSAGCCCVTGDHVGSIVTGSWTNGQPNGAIACVQSAFTNCSQSVTRLTGTNNICGTAFCYRFSVFAGSVNAIPTWFVSMFVTVSDSSSNSASTRSYGYIDSPDGFFLVNGAPARHSDGADPLINAVSFQFNATNSPNSITSVTMTVLNQTSSTSTTICLIGGSGCLQSAQTTTSSFLLYSASNILFSPGTYNVTISYTCPGCRITQVRILSLTLVISASAWIQNAVAGNTYIFGTSLLNNATQTLITAQGLTENVFVNGALYASTTTDTAGNTAFAWTPSAAGQYKIQVSFPRQSYYTNASFTIMVSVAHRTVILTAGRSPQDPDVSQTVTWNVSAYDMINNATVKSLPISQFVDGLNVSSVPTDTNGNAIFTRAFTSTGVHNVTFVSATTQVYSSATVYRPLTVFIKTSLTLTTGTITMGQQNTISVALTDANGNPLSTRTIQILINGAFLQNVTTGTNGQAQFQWQPNALGDYSITAKFSASAVADFGYRPSQSIQNVRVVPQTTINIDPSTSGTQSVSIPGGQSASQVIPSHSFSISFPNGNTISVTVNLGVASITVTITARTEFGWICVYRVNTFFGSYCALKVPFEKIYIDASISGILDLHIIAQLLGPLSIAYNVVSSVQVDRLALGIGVIVSTLIPLAGWGIFALTGGNPQAAADAVPALMFAAVLGGLVYKYGLNDEVAYRSYLTALLVMPLAGLACAISGYCPLSVPAIAGIPQFLPGLYSWATYERGIVLTLLQLGDFEPAMAFGAALILTAAFIAIG